MHPAATHSRVNLRHVALDRHSSIEHRGRRIAVATFFIGLFTGLTLAGWIAGIPSLFK